MSSENTSDNLSHEQENNNNSVEQATEEASKHRPTDVAELHQMLDNLEENHKSLTEKMDRVMRAFADADNRMKRAEKDKLDAIKYAPMKMARDMLDVADNFERALKSFPQTEDEKLKEVFEGLSLTEKSLHQVLGRFEVKPIDVQNASFDPNIHEAVTQIPIPDKKSGEIIDVIRKGYMMGERLLRPAQVITVS